MESEDRFEKAFRSMPLLASIRRLSDGIITDVNEEWLERLGYERDEVIGRSAQELGISVEVPKGTLGNIFDRFNDVTRKGPATVPLRCKSGNVREYLCHAAQVIELDGEKHLLLLTQDTTDERRREELLRQSQKMEAVGQLTGGIAHDFNNILAGVSGNLDLIDDPDIAAAEHQDRVVKMKSLIRRGSALTNQLLTYSRKQALEPKPVDVGGSVGNLLELMRRTLGESISIETVFATGLWQAHADPNQLENAILNLAINARDAMVSGGRLTIHAHNVEVDGTTAEGRDLSPGAYVAVTVGDTGHGMPKGVMERATEPFFTTKGVGEGSGLGLSMVDGFSSQSGGGLEIDSTEGVGSKITIYLPRASRQLIEKFETVSPEKPERGNGERILVIEDDPDVREATTRSLERLGYAVVDGGDGTDAVSIAANQDGNIDLVLTDVVLPNGKTGPDLAKTICDNAEMTRVLLMTGYAEKDLLRVDNEAGRYPLLQKPFQSIELGKMVRQALAHTPSSSGHMAAK